MLLHHVDRISTCPMSASSGPELKPRQATAEAQLHAIFDQSAAGMAVTNPDGQFTRVNDCYCRITGRSREDLLQLRMQDITHPDDLSRNLPMFEEAVRTGNSFEIEKRYVRPDGSIVWVHNSVAILRSEAGQLLNTLAVSIDVTERKRFERHLELLVAELNHRVKNTLAVVQSLAHQTFSPGRPPEEAIAAYEGRLTALAAAHNLLTANNWEVACISDVVAAALKPFCTDSCRLAGPPVMVTPRVAVSLTLALHELATNAEKYGSLASPSGVVDIQWDVLPQQQLELRWTERGGAPVEAPTRTGFGMRLLKRALAADLGGTVEVDFQRAGLMCRLTTPTPESSG